MAPRKRTTTKKSGSVEPKSKKSANDGSASRVRRRRNPSPTQRVTRSLSASSSVRLDSLPDQPRKRAKKLTGKEKVDAAEEAPAAVAGGGAGNKNVTASKTIVIEHCKQCNQIKVRAIQVKSGLEASIPGVKVLVNPEKPRFGCFEIREEGGDAFLTILGMKRPFVELKALDMNQVVADIVEKLK